MSKGAHVLTPNLAKRARTQGTPLIDGRTVTFVWLGESAPLLAGDFTDWERGRPVEMTQAGRNLWVHRLELPGDAYMEYAFLDGEERLPDPYNPRTTPNGVGNDNHYFYMPQSGPTPLARPRRGIQHGVVSLHSLEADSLVATGKRKLALYQPPGDDPAPLLLVWDGDDYLRRARLPVIVDNLIAQGRIQPIALAMVQNGGPARMLEYGCSDTTLLFLHEVLLPFAREHLNLLDSPAQPGVFGVLGASMGGLMALYTALRMPHIFGKALCQSGAYAFGAFDTITYDLAHSGDPQAVKIWLEVGQYDFQSLIPANRRMCDLLGECGYTFEYREYPAGHNYPAWRDQLWRGLEYLFPPVRE